MEGEGNGGEGCKGREGEDAEDAKEAEDVCEMGERRKAWRVKSGIRLALSSHFSPLFSGVGEAKSRAFSVSVVIAAIYGACSPSFSLLASTRTSDYNHIRTTTRTMTTTTTPTTGTKRQRR